MGQGSIGVKSKYSWVLPFLTVNAFGRGRPPGPNPQVQELQPSRAGFLCIMEYSLNPELAATQRVSTATRIQNKPDWGQNNWKAVPTLYLVTYPPPPAKPIRPLYSNPTVELSESTIKPHYDTQLEFFRPFLSKPF